ncbi:diguanylate cyclase (GGDEF) domain-containing protein/HDIG domain-containing protein [Paenibacillus sp. RU4T]|nr:diguanylate cyclase (GGDEF) domain-containing protein/HDIG domain-containing protein [Paenibacillus sp. RU4X]SIR61321.1 diguanylate cyclase (GGDEF) domain-containing protein/HDIG domain-containing protein [Paenibacillus sp. RU4T]
MKRMLGYFKEPSNIYFLLITLIGSFLFLSYFYPFDFVFSTSEWVLIYAMIAGVILMDHYMFQIPPEGNRQSMDSTVFLAALFIYGARMAFIFLLLSAIIIAFYKKQVPWWKHMINFAVYTIMIASAQTVYSSMGGMENGFSLSLLPAYSLSLTVYFMVNVLLIAGYYFLLYKGKLVVEISRLFLQECIFAYLITLLLAIVLQILIVNTHFFGLFLFLIIAVLLSHVFKQLFFMYHEINDKANKDQRTGLYNHSYLEEKLDDFIKTYRENGKIFSFAMLDLDDFKKYNDLYGHPQGDKLLSFVGSIIKAECEPQEFVCARYGGEEFAVIMPGCGKNEARKFINQLRKTVNNSPFEGVEILPHGCVSFSAGVMEMNAETYEKSQLVGLSDRAMYISKSKGKNTVTIYGEQTYLPQKFEHEINELEQQIRVFLSKDVYTFKHSKRVFSYAVDMAEKLGLNEEERRTLILGALIHDIGKLEIPREVLTKRAKLSKEEWELVKQHVTFGKEFLLASGTYSDLVPLVELHHERYDGTGYPHGLKGTEIPKLARLLCIIDSFDAMTTERPYQRTRTFAEAVEEIRACSGSQFDPELAVPFIAYVNHRIEQDDIPEEIIQQLREQQEREGA